MIGQLISLGIGSPASITLLTLVGLSATGPLALATPVGTFLVLDTATVTVASADRTFVVPAASHTFIVPAAEGE